MNLDRLEIVLVRPETARNVGSVARACRNFGVSGLCIVGSPGILEDGAARATAHACEDLLESARQVASLEEALAPHTFAVGTANRVRKGKLPPLELPHQILPDLGEATIHGSAALVFGPESRGLTDTDLAFCTRLMRIPTAVDQPSLNLSQAVLVALQECWRSAQGWTPSLPPASVLAQSASATVAFDPASYSEFDLVLTSLERLMDRAGFRPYAGDPETFRLAARRTLARGRFERRDLRTLLTIAKTLERLGSSEIPTKGSAV